MWQPFLDPFVEDNAQGMFSTLNNQELGTFADFSVGSFHTTKPLRLGWHKINIDNEKIQPLPSYIRYFPDDYNLFQKIIFYLYREVLSPGRFIKKFLYKKK